MLTVSYLSNLTIGEFFVAQNKFNQWLANHWLNNTNH